jgi:hypothetical protein
MEPLGQQNLDVLSGIDSLNSDLLTRDTDRRLSDLFNDQPKQNPNIKITGLESLNPTYKAPDLTEEQQMMLNLQAIEKRIPNFQKGFGSKLTSEDSVDKQGRFLDETYGYKFGVDNDDFYASKKNDALNFVGKLIGRFALGTVAKVGQGLGYLGGMIDPSNWGHNYIMNVADNSFAKFFEQLDTTTKNDWMPTYQAAINRDRGFWSRMFTDSTFWTNEASDGAAFMASAFAPGLILSKIGLGAKVAVGLGKVGEAIGAGTEIGENATLGASKWAIKAADYLQNAEKIKNGFDIGLNTALNTASESMFEAKGVADTVYNDAVAKGVDQDKAREIANNSATNSFLGNLIALSVSNLWEQKLIHGLLNKTGAASTALGRTEGSALEGSLKLSEPTSKWAKFWDSPHGTLVKNGLKGAGIEGFYEENIQLAIQRNNEQLGRENTQLALEGFKDFNQARKMKGMAYGFMDMSANILSRWAQQTKDAVSGNDTEAAMNIGMGALMGAPFGMMEGFHGHKDEKARAQSLVDNLNWAGQNWVKQNQFYKTEEVQDAQGNKTQKVVTDDKGKPIVDLEKITAFTNEQRANSEALHDIMSIQNPQLQSILKKQLFSQYIQASILAGRYDQVIEDLSHAENLSPTKLLAMGIDPSQGTKEQIQEYKKLAGDIKDLHESIDNDILLKNKDLRTEGDQKLQQARKAHLFQSGAALLIFRDENAKLQTKIDALKAKLAPTDHETDPLVDSLNDVNHKISSQSALLDHLKSTIPTVEHESHPDLKTGEKVLSDLKEQKEKLEKDNEDAIKILKKKDGQYEYQNPDKAKNPEAQTLKLLQNQKGEMDNSNRQQLEDWYKYANYKDGFENFKAKYDQNVKEAEKVIKEVDSETEKAPKKNANPFMDHQEINKGDFYKIPGVVTKQLLGEELNEEDKSLAAAYGPLIDDLRPIFEQKLNQIRKLQLEHKAENLMKLNDQLKSQIEDTKDSIIEMELQAEDALNKYKNNPSPNKEGALKSLARLMNALNKKITAAEADVAEYEKQQDINNQKIDILLQDIENDYRFQNLIALKDHVAKEKAWVQGQIADTKTQIKSLKDLIQKLIQIMTDLFPNLSHLLEKGKYSAVNAVDEVRTKEEKLAELQSDLKDLKSAFESLDKRDARIKQDVAQLKTDFSTFAAQMAEEAIRANQNALGVEELSAKDQALEELLKKEAAILNSLIVPKTDDWDGKEYIRELSNNFYSTTDPVEDATNPRVQRHKEFLNTVSQMSADDVKKKLGDGTLQVILVTAHNIQQLGLSGLVDSQYLSTTKGSLATTGIYPVYVIKDKDGSVHYVNKSLDKIGKVGDAIDHNQLVFTSLKSAEYKQGQREKYEKKYTKAQVDRALEQAIKYRQEIMDASLQSTREKPITYNIALTRGLANRQEPLEKDMPVKNAVEDSLVQPGSLSHKSVKVFTTASDLVKGTAAVSGKNGIVNNMPVGRPFLSTNNGIDQRFHYLDNNNLSKDQVETVLHVVHQLVKEMQTTLDDIIIKMNGGVKVERSSERYMELVKKFNKENKDTKISLLNKNYLDYLRGVVYWGALDKGAKITDASESQMWIRAGKLYYGNTGNHIDLLNADKVLEDAAFRRFIEGRKHHVNALGEKTVAKPFTEYRFQDGKLSTQEWPTYAHYLLSKHDVDGKTVRKDIPLTTAIKTREQSTQEGKPHQPYIQQGIILTDKNRELFDKKPPKSNVVTKPSGGVAMGLKNFIKGTEEKKEEEQKPVEVTPAKNPNSVREGLKAFLATGSQQAEQAAKTSQEAKTEQAPGKITPAAVTGSEAKTPPGGNINPITGKPAVFSSTPPVGSVDEEDIDNFLFNAGVDPSNFRVINSTEVEKEIDLPKVVADVQRMLPQFPVQILGNLIQAIGGRLAWGQFTGAAIRVYEGAEHGTLYHEAFEALVNTILSDREWKAMHKEFTSREGTFVDRETGQLTSYSTVTEHQAKEQMAEEFAAYKEQGILPIAPKQKSFFQKLWDFIKSLVMHRDSIAEVFAKLDKGEYSRAAVSLTNRFTNSYKLKNIPEVYKHKFIRGATALMFQDAFYSDRSLTDFDNMPDDKDLYNRLKDNLSTRYSKFEAAVGKANLKPAMQAAAENAIGVWKMINSQWDDFVQDHKTFLKAYKVEFQPEVNESQEEEDNTANRNDYVHDMMTLDVKKTASASTRLLFGSLIQSRFSGSITSDLMPGVSDLSDPTNPVFLPDLVNYDSFVKKIFNAVAGLNKESRIKERLEAISGIKQIKEASNPEQLIKEINARQAAGDPEVSDMANIVRLYNRLFTPSVTQDGSSADEESQWKLRVKANAYLAKQAPQAELMIVTSKGSSYFLASNSRDIYEKAKRLANARLRDLKSKGAFSRSGDNFVLVHDFSTEPVSSKADSKDFIEKFNGWFAQDGKEIINQGFWQSLSQDKREKMADQLTQMRAVIKRNGKHGVSIVSLDGLGVEQRFNKLMNEYVQKVTDTHDTQFFNLENKPQSSFVLNNYMSRTLSEINGYDTKEEFLNANPQYRDLSAQGSQLIDKLFNADDSRNTSFSISLGYNEGLKNSTENEGIKNSKLSFIDRNLSSFNANLDGMYYTLLPADAETEWSNRFKEANSPFHFVDYKDNFLKEQKDNVLSKLRNYLRVEMMMAKTFHNSHLQQLNKDSDFKINGKPLKIGQALRFYKDILSQKTVDAIHQDLHSLDGPGVEDILKKYSRQINSDLIKYIEQTAEDQLAQFEDMGIVQYFDNKGLYRFNLFNDTFATNALGISRSSEEGYFLTPRQVEDIMQFHVTNYMMANQEMVKLYFGDVAQFKDLTKRVKSFTSGVEWAFFDEKQNEGLNEFLNQKKNTAEADDTSVEIPADDLTHYSFSNELNMVVGADLMVTNPELHGMLNDPKLKDLLGNMHRSDAYKDINEADAQSATDIQTFREIMMKSGWRWTDAHEEQYQYEMAYARQGLERDGVYKYSSKQLEAADKKILNSYTEAPAIAEFSPLKPLYAGIEPGKGFTVSLLKTSIFPITYRLAEQYELKDLYTSMLKGIQGQRVNVFTFESSHKLGLQTDDNGRITPTYDPSNVGKLSSFAKTPIEKMSFAHFGIQVETQSSKNGSTLGTQLTKDIKLNLFDMGAPVDYLGSLSGEDRVNAMVKFWGMNEEQKRAASQMYSDYARHEDSLRNLKQVGYQQLIDRLGAKESQDEQGNFKYEFKDLTKVRDIILSEMQSREIDENTVDSVQLKDDLKSFVRAAESLPSYDTIRNILYSLVDKSILSPKVNGKPYIQVAASFFNKGKRQAGYYGSDGKWNSITSKAQLDKAIEDGVNPKKIIYTSSELGFYKFSKDGKEIQGMEIMIPSVYRQRINEKRVQKGLDPMTDEQIIKYLEDNGPELLEGVGFRIPTQATSSIEFFKIKGFLPESFGTAVVVPSEITKKAGSDFDVDKLTTYLNNWELNKKGMPQIVKFKTDENSKVEDRYVTYVQHLFKDKLEPIQQKLNSLKAKLGSNSKEITRIQKELDLFEELGDDSSAKLIAQLFNVQIKSLEDAIEAEDTLANLEIEGTSLSDISYQVEQELKSIVDQLKTELTLAEFSQRPLHLQNSRAANENQYFDAIRNILKKPYMMQFLLSPNSMENIESNRAAVKKAEDPNWKPDTKGTHYGQFLNFNYMTTQRHYFVRGKKDIGIFAVAMTSHANAQLNGLAISPVEKTKLSTYDQGTMDRTGYDWRLPFKANEIKINGVTHTALGSIYDQDQKSIMDKISGYINGAVDVAKDPVIMDMGMLSELAGVYMLLERAGVKGESIALFMKQPIIRQFIKYDQLKKSALKHTSPFDTQKELINHLFTLSAPTGYQYEHHTLSDVSLAKMIEKMAKRKPGEPMFERLSQAEKIEQAYILANFMKMRMFANHLFSNIASTNHDTSNIRSNHLVTYKEMQYEDVLEGGNAIKSLAHNTDAASAIRKSTFVGSDIDILHRVQALYGDQIFSLQKQNPATLLKYLGRKVYDNAFNMRAADFEAQMKVFETKVLDYMSNNAQLLSTEKKMKVKDLATRLFRDQIRKDGAMVDNPNSLFKMWSELKSQVAATPNHTLSNNLLLKKGSEFELNFEPDPLNGITTFKLNSNPIDVYSKNRVTEALRELKESESSSRIYHYLIAGSIIQNGVRFRRDSINNRIPNEDYGAQIDKGLENIDNQDFRNFEEVLARSSKDTDIVQEGLIGGGEKKFIGYYALGQDILSDKTTLIKTAKNAPSVFNRIFFGKQMPPVIFMYAGGEDSIRTIPDYYYVQQVRPEYAELGENGWSVTPEARAMAQKGDFSFMENILFRRVGVGTGTIVKTTDRDMNPYKNYDTGKAKSNAYVAYKPINSWGSKNFNEIKDVSGATRDLIGDSSSLLGNRQIREDKDEVVLEALTQLGLLGNQVEIIDNPQKESSNPFDNQTNTLSSTSSISSKEIDDILDQNTCPF